MLGAYRRAGARPRPTGSGRDEAPRAHPRARDVCPRRCGERRGAPSSRTPGGDLLSQGVSPQVPSALAVFTSVFGMGTGVSPPLLPPEHLVLSTTSTTPRRVRHESVEDSRASTSTVTAARRRANKKIPSPRPISTGRLNTSPCVHLRPINLVVYQGPYSVDPMGDLISRLASRLDAFSAYPFRRSPTSRALGRTTGTRELRPSRSSRTRDSSSQISYAHRG